MTQGERIEWMLDQICQIEHVSIGVVGHLQKLRELTYCHDDERLLELSRKVETIWIEHESLRWRTMALRDNIRRDALRLEEALKHNADQDEERDAEYEAALRDRFKRAATRKRKCKICGWPNGSAECKSHHASEEEPK
jgi:hypothetical protein